MKKFNKYISLALVAITGGAFVTSCDDSKDNDFVQEYDGPSGVYFSNTENNYLELTEDATTISYPVYRDVAGEELTVAVTTTPVEIYSVRDIYTFPSSVTFPAGSKVADFTITYDISKAQIGVEQQYELQLDVESNPFSSNNVVITLVNPAPWTYLGIGDYYDLGFGISPESSGPAKVTVWQQGLDENIFRISNPYYGYNEIENSYFEFRILQQGQSYLGVSITEPDLVAYGLYYMTYNPDDGDDMYIAFPGLFIDDISYWVNNRVTEYQDNGLPGVVQLAPAYYLYNLGQAYNYPAFDPYITLNFPNYVSLDRTLELTYEGVLTPASQIQEVLIDVTVGGDLTNVRAALAPGKDANALIQAIEDGTAKYTEFNSSGYVHLPFGNENETGDYTVAVVGYIGEEVKATASTSFFYISSSSDYDPNEGWTSLGYVDYTDGFVCANIFLEAPIQTYSLELQQNEATPGYYRLVNPYGEPYPYNAEGDYNAYIDSYLYFNMEDPTRVWIYQSTQTLDWGEYGALNYIWSMANYFQVNGSGGEPVTDDQIAAAGYFGTYEDGKITFPESYVEDDVLYATLAAYWTYVDEPQYNGLVYANAVLDYDNYVNSNYTQPYMLNQDGSLVNPFCIDMSSLSAEANRINGHVMLGQKALTTIKPAMNNLLKVKRPSLPIEQKSGKANLTTPVKAERLNR